MVLRDDCLNSRRRHCVNRRTCCYGCTKITARHMYRIHGDYFMACALHGTWHRNYVGRTIHYDERREPEYVRQTMPRMHSFGRVCSHDEKHLCRWVCGLRGFQGVNRISKALTLSPKSPFTSASVMARRIAESVTTRSPTFCHGSWATTKRTSSRLN